jgi:hypothetical protein
VLRGAAGSLVLPYLPIYSPWLNPIEMLRRHIRREVTHCELFATIKALVATANTFLDRYNRFPWWGLSIIGFGPRKYVNVLRAARMATHKGFRGRFYGAGALHVANGAASLERCGPRMVTLSNHLTWMLPPSMRPLFV